MKSIRETIRDVIADRLLPQIERDGISKLLLPEQIAFTDYAKSSKNNPLIRHYEYLIAFGLSGETPYCVGDKIFFLTPGAIVLMPRWTPHGTVQPKVRRVKGFDLDQSPLGMSMIMTMISIQTQILHDTDDPDVIEASNPYILLGQHFDGLTTRLLEEVQSRLPNYESIGQCIFKEFMERCLRSVTMMMDTDASTTDILTALTRRGGPKRESALPAARRKRSKKGEPAHEIPSGQLPSRIQAARKFIYSNYYMPIGLDEIAYSANISADYFGRQFKAAIGLTPIQYLLKVRMEIAMDLLSTNLNIREVAHMVGIEDARYFSRIFRRSTGVSPLQYRRKITQTTK